jgi:plasmid stabilization system protein ParE
MSYAVRVLRRAEQDVDEILHFIAHVRKSPAGARSWYQAYEKALQRLAAAADTLALAPENDFVDFDLRQILFKTPRGRTFRAIFTIVGDEVRLLHIRGPGQDVMSADEIELPDN